MATLTEIHRESDAIITFQLFKADGTVEVVGDILTMSVELTHKHSLVTIGTYVLADLTLNAGDNTIDLFLLTAVTADEQTGVYKIRVEWDVVNLDFPDGTEDSVDEQDVFILLA